MFADAKLADSLGCVFHSISPKAIADFSPSDYSTNVVPHFSSKIYLFLS